jgi:hypothetical protein
MDPDPLRLSGLEKKIIYFEETGTGNTDKLLSEAKLRAKELGIKDFVVASTHGGTALKAKEAFGEKANVVAVTISEGYRENDWCMTGEERKRLQSKGIKVFTGTHALGDGVASAFTDKSGGKSIEEIARDTLYRFGQGMKVAVEVALMAADAGLIPMDREVMAIGGTGEGADTCIVVKPAYPRKFHELEIREIVAKPRNLS